MVKVGELYGELRLNKRPFDQSLDQAEGKAKGWSSRVGGILSGAAGFLAKWGTIGAAAVGGFAYATANMASDLAETKSKVSVVFGDWAEDILHWGENSATAFGMSQNSALGAAGTYGNLFRAMGIGAEKTTEMSTNLVELAADLASFNNMDPTEVLDKLRAGLSGETEPLRTLGVNLNQATIEAKALELGLWNGKGTIDAAAKAQASYALILEQTTLAQGDFQRTQGGMANQQRILSATFQDTMAKIGEAFMPIIIQLLPMFRDALVSVGEWVTANMPAIQEVIGTVMEFVGAAISFVFTEIIPRLIDAFNWFSENVVPVFQAALQAGGEGVNIFGGIIDWISTNIMPAVMAIFQVVTEQVLPALQEAFAGVQGWIKDNWPAISSIVNSVANVVKMAFNIIAAVIKAVMPIIIEVAKIVFPALGTAATLAVNVISAAFKIGEQAFKVFGDVTEGILKVITGLWDNFKGFFRTTWTIIGNILKGGINVVIDLLNGLLGFLNGIRIGIPEIGIPGTDIKVGGGYLDPFDIPLIPRLARGTRAWPGGWAMVGERGPELAYLPAGANVYSNQETRGMVGGRLEVVLRDPDGALPPGVSERGVARLLEDALNSGAFVRALRHDAVRS